MHTLPYWHVYAINDSYVVNEITRVKSDLPETINFSFYTKIPDEDIKKAQYSKVFFGIRTDMGLYRKYATIPLGYEELMEFQIYTSSKTRYIQQCKTTISATDSRVQITIWRQCLKSDWYAETNIQTQYCNLPGFTFYLNQIELFF